MVTLFNETAEMVFNFVTACTDAADGQPFRAGVRFTTTIKNWDGRLFPHDLSRRRENVLFGAEDPRLEEFRTDSCRTISARYRNPDTAVTLQDAISAARSYIAACSSPVAKEIEGWDYQRIGGEPHIAAITPKEGFHWWQRPEQFDAL